MTLLLNLLLALLSDHLRATRRRLATIRRRDDGFSVEAVVVISLLVILALAAVGAIAGKVKAMAEGIDLDGHP